MDAHSSETQPDFTMIREKKYWHINVSTILSQRYVFITVPRDNSSGHLGLFTGSRLCTWLFIFNILCYDPACLLLRTAAYDTIDPGSQYPVCLFTTTRQFVILNERRKGTQLIIMCG